MNARTQMDAYVIDPEGSGNLGRRTVDVPTPAAGEVVVDVRASSLNRGEVMHVRSGALESGSRPGWDFAGVVAAAAPDGGPAVGDRVFGWSPERGAWSQFVKVPVEHAAPMPDGLSMDDASTLGVAGLTALAATRSHRDDLAGRSVLVTGATGGVGTLAIQLASLAGARVTAVVRRAEDAEVIEALTGLTVPCEVGLDAGGERCDLIIESVGGETLSTALERVALDGTVVSLGRTTPNPSQVSPGWFLRNARLDGLAFARRFAAPGATVAALGELATMVVAGDLSTGIQHSADFADLPAATDLLVDRGVRGKVVVTQPAA